MAIHNPLRQWIDVRTESDDPHCFQVSQFITRFLRHSQKVYRVTDGAVYYDQVIDECKKKQSDNTGYWLVERKKEFVNAPRWSIEKLRSVLAKKADRRKGLNIAGTRTVLIEF